MVWGLILNLVAKNVKLQSENKLPEGVAAPKVQYSDTPQGPNLLGKTGLGQDWLGLTGKLLLDQNKAMSDFNSNPLNRLAYGLGLKGIPKTNVLGDGVQGPLTPEQEQSQILADQLMESQKPERGLFGTIMSKITGVN